MFIVGEYKVTFRYTGLHRRPVTLCCISLILGGIQKGDAPLLQGKAECSRKDQFNKNIGRKHALARALQGFPKAERKVFWDAYFKTVKNGKR
jgi:hypothetical protein